MFARETTPVIDLLALDPYIEDALTWYGARLDDEARELTLGQLCARDGVELARVQMAVAELVDPGDDWDVDEALEAANRDRWIEVDLYDEAM